MNHLESISSVTSPSRIPVQSGTTPVWSRNPYDNLSIILEEVTLNDAVRTKINPDEATTEIEPRNSTIDLGERSRLREIIYSLSLSASVVALTPQTSLADTKGLSGVTVVDEPAPHSYVLHLQGAVGGLLDSAYQNLCSNFKSLAKDHSEITAGAFGAAQDYLDRLFLAENLPFRVSITGDESILLEFKGEKGKIALLDFYPANEVILLRNNGPHREIVELTYSDSEIAVSALQDLAD
jgi:hypothetical protein